MTMLATIQKFCRRTNLPVPNTVYGSSDPQIRQALNILEEEGNDLSGRGAWERITFEATHTTLAQEDQGSIESIATNGFRYILNDTFWDRDLREPVWGPVSDSDWQALKAMVVTGPRSQYRIRGDKLLANPSPPAGHTWAFEYVSWNWILDNDGTTYKQYFTEDTDDILLPEEIVLNGMRWRWMREKGLSYAELFNTYELQVKDALGRDGGKRKLNMGGRTDGPRPMVFVPSGSWITP